MRVKGMKWKKEQKSDYDKQVEALLEMARRLKELSTAEPVKGS